MTEEVRAEYMAIRDENRRMRAQIRRVREGVAYWRKKLEKVQLPNHVKNLPKDLKHLDAELDRWTG